MAAPEPATPIGPHACCPGCRHAASLGSHHDARLRPRSAHRRPGRHLGHSQVALTARRTPQRSWSGGAPGRTRTCDPPLRRRPLYPAELQGHGTAPPAAMYDDARGITDSLTTIPARGVHPAASPRHLDGAPRADRSHRHTHSAGGSPAAAGWRASEWVQHAQHRSHEGSGADPTTAGERAPIQHAEA